MKPHDPPGLDRPRLARLLSRAKKFRLRHDRIDFFSRQFLECPYESSPLIGSAERSEVFTAAMEGFDCVTYIETVLALARASSVPGFIEWLRKLRYENGRAEWRRRNHYMTQWIRSNARSGVVRPISAPGIPVVSRERVLNVVPGLPIRRTRVKSVPKAEVTRLAPLLRTGDLIFFASTRRNLDVFHAGIIFRDRERILMRHASRSQGGVVEQELSEFLRMNRMAGVIAVRPL